MKRMLGIVVALALTGLLAAPSMAQNEGRMSRKQRAREADAAQFAMIEQHVRTMEECMAMVRELSAREYGGFHIVHPGREGQENYDIQKINRYTQMKTEASHAIDDIIAGYFLSERLQYPESSRPRRGDPYDRRSIADGTKPEDSPLMPSYLRYTRMLFYLHKAMVYNVWARDLTLPGKPRNVRNLMGRFRTMWEDAQNEEWHDNRKYSN